MIALLQRVDSASVTVGDETVGRIGRGLLVFLAVERGDSEAQADRLVDRVMHYRLFADSEGRMNRSVRDIGGEVLMVSQFTLAADTRKGTRASFGHAADPALGKSLFDHMVATAEQEGLKAAFGVFGAHMRVALENDGPVTFLLRVPPPSRGRPPTAGH